MPGGNTIHLLAKVPCQDNHRLPTPVEANIPGTYPTDQGHLQAHLSTTAMSQTAGPTQSHHSCSWTLTLIMLQEPVCPHVPHLHCVVHARGSNARAAGVEVHVSDKAGKTREHVLEEGCSGSEHSPRCSTAPSTQKTSLLPHLTIRWPRENKERVENSSYSALRWTVRGKSQHQSASCTSREVGSRLLQGSQSQSRRQARPGQQGPRAASSPISSYTHR